MNACDCVAEGTHRGSISLGGNYIYGERTEVKMKWGYRYLIDGVRVYGRTIQVFKGGGWVGVPSKNPTYPEQRIKRGILC